MSHHLTNPHVSGFGLTDSNLSQDTGTRPMNLEETFTPLFLSCMKSPNHTPNVIKYVLYRESYYGS